MDYRIEINFGAETIEGTLSIEGYMFQISFDSDDFSFKASTYSEGEDRIVFKHFNGSICQILELNAEGPDKYSGIFIETEKRVGIPDLELQRYDVEMNVI